MNTVLFVNATIGFSENLILVKVYMLEWVQVKLFENKKYIYSSSYVFQFQRFQGHIGTFI